MENSLTRLVNTLLIPILLLDFLGGIIGFIWLVILGEWGIIIGGVLYMIIGAFAVSILLIPSLLLIAPISYFAKRENIFGIGFFGLISVSYVAIIIYVSCAWIFNAYTESIPAGNTMLPYLLWSYAIAIAPWAYMASKEDKDSTGTFLALFFAKLGLACTVILTGFLGFALSTGLSVFAVVMFIEILVTASLTVALMKQAKSTDDGVNNMQNVIDLEPESVSKPSTSLTSTDDLDTLIAKAIELIENRNKASTALFQRELHIGYATAAQIMEQLEDQGIVGPADGAKPRDIYIPTRSKETTMNTDELSDWETIKHKD